MHFSAKFVGLVATTFMPLLAQAIQLTSQFNSVTSGQQLTVTWTGDNTPVYISLENGGPGSNQLVANLGQGVSGTSSTITIPNVPSGSYTVQIRQSGQTSYSNQFQISGNGQGPAPNTNNNNNNINGDCDTCDDNNNNGFNNNGYPGDMETYVSTYISVFGTTTSTYTTTTTGPCTTGYTSCVQGATQVINGITYTSSCTNIGQGYNPTTCNLGATSVVNGITYQPTCTGFQVINGVTQYEANGAAGTTPVFQPGTATTLPLTGTFTTATGTTTGVQSFFGAAPKLPLSAGAAVLAGGLVALIVL